MNELTTITQSQTMSSLQIAELTGKRHSNVMRDIRKMAENLNQFTSESVGSEYHRGDRTQYKYLSERTQNALLDFAIGKNASQYIITETSYTDTKGEKRAMYSLNKKACFLLASGYDVVLRAKIIDRWEELETQTPTNTKFRHRSVRLFCLQPRSRSKSRNSRNFSWRRVSRLPKKTGLLPNCTSAQATLTKFSTARILLPPLRLHRTMV